MAIQVIFKTEEFHWLDIKDPTRAELEDIAHKYGLHYTSIQECLDPQHLPKYEKIGDISFILLRFFDEACSPASVTVQQLTRKIAIFYTKSFIISIYRQNRPLIEPNNERWKNEKNTYYFLSQILHEALHAVLRSYEKPVYTALNELESLEASVFGTVTASSFEIQKAYYLKRRASVFKRMLHDSIEILPKLSQSLDIQVDAPEFQSLKELAENYYFYSNELEKSISSLLNLHLSLESKNTNESMRILTMFSCFLLPLAVISGFYGMNFDYMPEFHWRVGYPFVVGLMILAVLVTFIWFRRKKWL